MGKMHPKVLRVVDFFGLRSRALLVARDYPKLTQWVAGIGFMAAGMGIVYSILDVVARYDTPAGGDTLEVLVALVYVAFMIFIAILSVAMLAAAKDVKRDRASVKVWPSN